ncbi:flagellar hook-basal body complex protein [Arcobacteraceae bacterium]|nr:flagellar hook-basal body complex protein [Arcobacteraceae bacterium]
MNGSIYTGASALLSYQSALNVESNNVANVNTVGFKSDTVSFADMMYQDSVGMGVSMNDPIKHFEQGSLVETGLDYDFAISGEGFFTVTDPLDGSTYYTRAGNFQTDAASNLVDGSDNYVMGVLPTITGDKITSDFSKNIGSTIIEDDTTIISSNTFATDYTKTATTSGISGTDYKTASNNISDIEELRIAYQSAISAYEKDITEGEEASFHIDEVTFPLITNADGEYRVEITINGVKYQEDFDTDVATTLNNLSDNINDTAGIISHVDTTTGVLTIQSIIPGQDLLASKSFLNEDVMVITNVSTESGSGKNLVDSIYTELKNLIESNGGKIATVQTEIVKTPSGTPPTLGVVSLNLDTLGISDNLVGSLVNDNGNIYLTQNGATYLIAKLAPVLFQESSSLNPEGNNLFSATVESGEPLFVAEKAEILNNYLEQSSTDLSEALVNLMVWQKAFDANSKTVTTSDELLQTALALKNS